MRAVGLWAASCVAGLVTFSCLGDSDEDGGTSTGGKGVTPEGGSSDTGGRPGSGGAATGGAEGTFDTCCVENRTTQCFCPAGSECNFGWYTEFFPDGTCCMEGDSSCSNGGAGGGGAGGGGAGGEAGTPGRGGAGGEGGGFWESCCEEGITEQCFCPGGSVCNFGADVDFFPDGTCCYFYFDGQDGPNSCNSGGGSGSGGAAAVGGAGGSAGSP